jgi:hypothetical protein
MHGICSKSTVSGAFGLARAGIEIPGGGCRRTIPLRVEPILVESGGALMTGIAILGGVLIMCFGVLYLAAPDLMWTLQRWGNSWEGQKSERSETWELGRVLRGLFLLIGGLVFMIWGLSID